VDIHGPRFHEGFVPPDAVEQLILAVDGPGMAGEKLDQLELAGTKLNGSTVQCHLIGREIDVKPPKLSFGNILFEAIRVTIILLTHKSPLYNILPPRKRKFLSILLHHFWYRVGA
jgi:hypothetical protein